MTKRDKRLRANTEATERWERRLFRAANELQKLKQERKRLYKLLDYPVPDTRQAEDPLPVPPDHIAEERRAPVDVPAFVKDNAGNKPLAAKPDDGLDIPAELLVRNRKLQTLPDPKTKEKKAERRAIEKEKRYADLTGKRRRMPLTGKAAVDEIRKSQ
jgi:hypothetical protein